MNTCFFNFEIVFKALGVLITEPCCFSTFDFRIIQLILVCVCVVLGCFFQKIKETDKTAKICFF
jgi:hypothetical protein